MKPGEAREVLWEPDGIRGLGFSSQFVSPQDCPFSLVKQALSGLCSSWQEELTWNNNFDDQF